MHLLTPVSRPGQVKRALNSVKLVLFATSSRYGYIQPSQSIDIFDVLHAMIEFLPGISAGIICSKQVIAVTA
jgi:hypothetical protein